MSVNKWSLYPPSWWPFVWWPFRSTSEWNISFYNGLKALARYPAQPKDVRIRIANIVYGVETAEFTDDTAGCIRIKTNGVVRSIVHA